MLSWILWAILADIKFEGDMGHSPPNMEPVGTEMRVALETPNLQLKWGISNEGSLVGLSPQTM